MTDTAPPRLPLGDKLRPIWRPLLLLGLLAALIWWVAASAAASYHWQWYRAWAALGAWTDAGFAPGPLLRGLGVTLQLTAAGLALALGIGVLLAGMRLSPSPTARLAAGLFLNVVRNTPLLMQLFIVYFIAAPVFGLPPFWAAALALAAFEGCYMAEIFRAGVGAMPRSQWEAALSLGMSVGLAARVVIVPQAARHVLPPLVSQIISLIKDTSLVSAIAVADLTMRARVVISDTFLSLETWLLAAAIYLVLTLMISVPARMLEKRSNAARRMI